MKKLKNRTINFANIFRNLPEKYLKAMTDEEFHMAMFYNIWPDPTEDFIIKIEEHDKL